ncbi:polysaccharide deacetylase family protein [Methylobacterium sp. J-076]|uniref:polysaccharide deacetylase family protein n=1 Tax=Methylobacterium sp. J-076 TaxID=2836655 RepID=UPI001FB97EF2|nr:polysaccharide deacetylase family protein [Methylobacterium sp. J-076]MCJ2015111.1 polysaccharide deacetylase family protein [Methylobacterium sp. J-076]
MDVRGPEGALARAGARVGRVTGRALARRLGRRPARLPEGFPPTVSFTFDDFPESAFANALPVLRRANAPATWYVSCGLLGAQSPVGVIAGPERVVALHEAGHEIGDHTFGHLDARAVSAARYGSDLAANQDSLARLVPGLRPASFAYPYGQVTLGAKRAASARIPACRGTEAGIARGTFDLAMLPATALYDRAMTRAGVEALVADVARRGGWLIFYTHDVAPSPSPWGCSPSLFEASVAAALAAGLRLATVAAVSGEIRGRASA